MTHCLRVLGLAGCVSEKHARVPTLWSLGGGSAITLHLLKVITPRALSQERTEKIAFSSCKWLQPAYGAAVITPRCGAGARRGLSEEAQMKRLPRTQWALLRAPAFFMPPLIFFFS